MQGGGGSHESKRVWSFCAWGREPDTGARDWSHERLKGGSLAMLNGFRQKQETHVERLPESPRATVVCQANPAEPEWEDHVRRGAKRMVSI